MRRPNETAWSGWSEMTQTPLISQSPLALTTKPVLIFVCLDNVVRRCTLIYYPVFVFIFLMNHYFLTDVILWDEVLVFFSLLMIMYYRKCAN
ncbi:unnamed protein product [Arctogadus glacialis]